MALLASVGASVQAAAPETIIQARKAKYREIGKAFKSINDEVKKSAPDRGLIGSSASLIAGNLRQVGSLFPAGSGPSSGVRTKALPTIWTKWPEFARLNAAATGEAGKLVLASRGADVAAIAAQARSLGKACQACHQQFRDED
ncbi:c-type cytochrome [Sphingomonas solaris]|uniref:c-type cytochrome n=1 Tax=Alterirhizorhabdus solaris TaxID=2529389 RepID=UPI001396C67E|nr:cytochrome c [Sphingomonas solaris]